MILLLFAVAGIALAAVRGRKTGGRFSPEGILCLRGLWFLLAGLLLHEVPVWIPGFPAQLFGLFTVIWDLFVLIFLFLNRNRGLPVFLMIAGTLSNFCVIASNGFRMPVSPAALAMYPGMTPEAVAARKVGYFVAVRGANLYYLGDVVPVPFGRLGGFASAGDLLLGVGLMLLLAEVMDGDGIPTKEKSL